MDKNILLEKFKMYPFNPYNWQTKYRVRRWKMEENVKKAELKEEFKYNSFFHFLTLFHDYIYENELEKAERLFPNWEKLVILLKENDEYISYFGVFDYIIKMSKSYYLLINKSIEEANIIFENAMDNINLNDPITKANLLGMQVYYLLICECKDFEKMINLNEEAIKLEPNKYHSYLMLGNIYAKRRRMSKYHSNIFKSREIEYYEKALQLKRDYSTIVRLANSLCDISVITNNYDEKYEFAKRSSLLLKEFLDLELPEYSECYYLCGFVFLHLPGMYKDKELAKKCFLKSYQGKPANIKALLQLGFLFQNEGNLEEAIKYFKKADNKGSYWATINLYRLYFEKGEKDISEVIEVYKSLLVKNANNFNNKLNIKLELGSIFYYVKENLYEALQFWVDPIQNANSFPNVYSIFLFFAKSNDRSNIMKIAADETRKAIKNNTYKNSDELNFYEKVLKIIDKINPEILNEEPRHNFKPKNNDNSNWRIRNDGESPRNYHFRNNAPLNMSINNELSNLPSGIQNLNIDNKSKPKKIENWRIRD